MRTLANDMDVLGIPCPLWGACFSDSAALSYPEWYAKWVKPCPDGMGAEAWGKTAGEVYTQGPVTYYRSQHLN